MSQLISLSPLFSLLFFLLFYSIFAFSFSTSSLQLCHHDQRFALLQFKNSFSINSYASAFCDDYRGNTSYPKMLSWKENTDCCSWDGVTCDRVTGHIISLELSCSQLEGTIHSNSSLFLLPHLQRLNLAYNDFHQSPVSSGFGRFASLTHFNLSNSNFSGHIPSEISHLSKLVSLDLSSIYYMASPLRLNNPNLKKLIQNVIELRILDLSEVDMSLVDPTSLMNLSSSLTTLKLSYCGLRGKFPNNIFHLPNLHKLYLGKNYDLTGNFPKFNRSNPLEDLDVHSTSFSGVLSHSFNNLQSLKYLDLSDCHFSGVIPAGLGNLTQISSLSFSYNNFSGPIPSTLSKLELLTSLDLLDNHFNGSILTSFGNLTQMSQLYLSHNHFSGSIPTSFGNLTQMSELYLSDNHFSGSIPTSFGNLTQMLWLDLSSNDFSGSIPTSFGNLTLMFWLDLSSNDFSGSIPTSFGNFMQILHFNLSHNDFSGQIPSSLFKLYVPDGLVLSNNNFNGFISVEDDDFTKSLLSKLDLSSNDFSGQIPSCLGNLTQLTRLHLSSNNLSGQIPSWLGNLTQLDWLDLSSNNLSGLIPLSLSKLDQLSYLNLSINHLNGFFSSPGFILVEDDNFTQSQPLLLDLSSNNLSGQIPSWLGNLTRLEWLDLSSNNLSGLIPSSLSKLDQLTYLNLSNNHLNGFFSSPGVEQLPWKELQYLDLHSNMLQGPLPVPISNNRLTREITSLICNATSLEILNLSNNNLSGIIPQCLGNFSKDLSVLDLGMNSFHGTIPNTFVKGNALRNIALNGNQLKGPIPPSIINCSKLEVLVLGNNKINDTFPYWLETLPELQVLILRFNRFHSSIRSSKLDQPFPKLRIFDISNNDFSGPLPTKYFNYLKGMMNVNEKKYKRRYMGHWYGYDSVYYQDSVMVTIKGFDIELVKILTIYTTLDLSNNKFQGEIPRLIGKLTSLRFLNFSRNNLRGKIPSSLGNLRNLESLDLSSNNLNGEIPRELANLNFLSFLNLSQNHLEGQIPTGSQFDTFENTSYSENLGLCGAPLSKKCNDDETPQPPPFMIPKEDNPWFASGFEWKVMALGYGCGMVFGLVMGYFIFLIGKPEWVIRMVEGKHYKVRRLKKNGHRHGGRRN